MNNSMRVMVEGGRDGGLAIFEFSEEGKDTHVFSGDIKQAGEYLLARCTKLASKPVEVKKPERPPSQHSPFIRSSLVKDVDFSELMASHGGPQSIEDVVG